ncbi:hypothetical protein BASA81_013199 [Batrachochytrium salamandrivorans]|nr:hypothetical protein BASA81_013199 [Batrachochytrium salamandrivorans]
MTTNNNGSGFTDNDVWHTALPEALTGVPTETSSTSTSNFAETWVSQMVDSQDPTQAYTSKVHGKFIQMDSLDAELVAGYAERQRIQKLSRRTRYHTRHATKFSRRQQKALGMMDIPKENLRFDLFVPLHTLWTGYINEVVGDSNTGDGSVGGIDAAQTGTPSTLHLSQSQAETVMAKLCVKTKCPSNVGISGIVIKDTENMFHMITRQNKLKVIPKQGNVFTFCVGNALLTLYGNQFCTRPADRASKKFKAKPSVSL